jgi:hypothetical protein
MALNNSPDNHWVGPLKVTTGYVMPSNYADTDDLPADAPEGAVAYDAETHKLMVKTDSAWVVVGAQSA